MSLNGPTAARLYDEHVDAVYAYAARRVGPEVAISVVEDVFEQALRKNAQRPSHTDTDLGWLLALTTAFLRRHGETESRRLRNWVPTVRDSSRAIPRVTDPLLSSDTEDIGATTTARLMAAIADLEPVERDLLFLVAWEGCSSSLAAVATGIPPGEVRSRIGAIRKALRRAVTRPPAPTIAAADTTPASPASAAPAPAPATAATATPATAAPPGPGMTAAGTASTGTRTTDTADLSDAATDGMAP